MNKNENSRPQGSGQEQQETAYSKSAAPSLSLPKGGGALKGIDEKFEVNAVNGTAGMSIPLPFSQGRSDFSPSLGLSYNSGTGNSAFGMGWNLSLPSIQRRTDKQLPQYDDVNESDIFLFAGAEDLVPELDSNGAINKRVDPDPSDVSKPNPNPEFEITTYFPRVEGMFARIEKIRPIDQVAFYWKVTTRDNITTFFGRTDAARVADPTNPNRIYKWLPDVSYDDKGNYHVFEYKKEDMVNVPQHLHEKHRHANPLAITNTYLKKVSYGNLLPFYNDDRRVFVDENLEEDIEGIPAYEPRDAFAPVLPVNPQFFFSTVFDYGEHHATTPTLEEENDWSCRKDPFSNYKAGFEVRTYRLCKRVLCFHHFEELGTESVTLPGHQDSVQRPIPLLVRSLDISYKSEDTQNPLFANYNNELYETDYITSATQKAYKKDGSSYVSKALPAMDFEYQEPEWDTSVRTVTDESLVNAPSGLSSNYQWMDLWNEGISGILTEQAEGWYYKSNLGDGQFTPAQKVAPKPSFTGLSQGQLQIQDLEANGKKYVVSTEQALQGFFELNDDDDWEAFQSFKHLPNVDYRDPNTRFLDLTGDGMPDLLISQERVFSWYAAKGKLGYDEAKTTTHVLDEDQGPSVVFADRTQSIFLADISGDGLTDIVRIRNKDICYWPNLGYGRFGAKVTLTNAPLMDRPEQFNPAYIQLADISGTGVTDIIYLGKDQFKAWVNLSGNGFSNAKEIAPFPQMEQPNNIQMVDFLGNGTSCMVWSSPLPRYAQEPLRYIDLMGSKKPYLMKGYKNNAGKEVSITYKSSTKYYLEDKAKGTPWITKLPFPVHCVEKSETKDVMSGATYAQQYSYHHGYYDHAEREFRGFGRVETTDTETFSLPALDNNDNPAYLDEPQVHSKTWYHTGFFLGEDKILNQYKDEYFDPADYNGEDELGLAQPALDSNWTALEQREAVRALKGVALRQEVYALDKSAKEHLPYTTSEVNYKIQRLQKRAHNPYGVFLVTENESISYNYERNPEDPRIAHSMNLVIDELGNVQEQAAVVYRRYQDAIDDADVPDEVETEQQKSHIIYSTNEFTNDINIANGAYRLRLPYQVKQYELTGVSVAANNFFDAATVKSAFDTPNSEIPYTQLPTGSTYEKRCIEAQRTVFLNDDVDTVLTLGVMESYGFPYQSYRLAFTDALIDQAYRKEITNPSPPPATIYQDLITDHEAYFENVGEYVKIDDDYWIPSGTVNYPATNPEGDFYMPVSFTDPFNHTTTVDYYESPSGYQYFLLLEKTTDKLGNVSSVAGYDFRTLQPTLLKDINDNLSETAYDILGMPVGVALLGKSDGDVDSLDGFDADADATNFFSNPYGIQSAATQNNAELLLQKATMRYVYDYSSLPLRVATISREKHHFVDAVHGGAEEGASPLQIAFEYSDGLGRVLMQKVQAESGIFYYIDSNGDKQTCNPDDLTNYPAPSNWNGQRWVGTGRTILNNKSKPVQQYEPYFSGTHEFEADAQLVEIGYTPTIYYDAIGRVIRTDMPNGTFSKVEFDAWQQKSYDANDTVQDSTWYDDIVALPMTGSTPAQTEHYDNLRDAKDKAVDHYDTPSIVHTDSLARPFYTIQMPDDTGNNDIESYVVLDIEGNTQKVIDGRGKEQLQYKHDMLGNVIYQNSIDGGERWMLNDVFGKPIYGWDDDLREFSNIYDDLHRPITKKVKVSSTTKYLEHLIYGEGETNPKSKNLRGQLIKHYDGAGLQRVKEYDFKGNPLEVFRQYVVDEKKHPDWTYTPSSVSLENDGTKDIEYSTTTVFDALNRPLEIINPDNSITKYTYHESGLLDAVEVEGVHSLDTDIINNIEYNAKGQRTKVVYENGTTTTYDYDEKTYQLKQLKTVRTSDSKVLQDLLYWYDAVGNITKQKDNAQQTVFFNNSIAEPVNDYTYDAMYRLIQVIGREHNGGTAGQQKPTTFDDAVRSKKAHTADESKMRPYRQEYTYDEVGNMTQQKHIATSDTNANWTRNMTVDSDSNRLASSSIGSNGSSSESYTYDNRGNMTGTLNHLTGAMSYNEENRLEKVELTATRTAYYQYDGGGQRVRKTIIDTSSNTTEMRKYVGGWEVYVKDINGTTNTERETLHIQDDQTRVALIDTPIVTQTSEPQLLRYQYSNHLGTATLELDDSAAIITYEEYYPYGSTSFQSGKTTAEVSLKRYRYTGKERDEETGLYYHGARYYIPWLCRWCAVDPLESKYAGLSSYNYSFNNPIMFTDSTGMGPDEKKPGVWYTDGHSTKFTTTSTTEEEFKRSALGKKDNHEFRFIEQEEKWTDEATGDKKVSGHTKYGIQYNANLTTGESSATDYSGAYPVVFEYTYKEKKKTEETPNQIGEEVDSKLGSTTKVKKSDGNDKPKSNSVFSPPAADAAPISVYNGLLRKSYQKKAAELKPLHHPNNPNHPENREGLRRRTALKKSVRKNSIAGARRMIDMIEGTVEEPTVLNDKGKVRRFYHTNKTYNTLAKWGRRAGYVGLLLSMNRIYHAEDKVKETTIITGGFAGAWAASSLMAPIAGDIGLKVGAINPVAGIIAAAAVLAIAGVMGAYFGESAVRKMFNWFD